LGLAKNLTTIAKTNHKTQLTTRAKTNNNTQLTTIVKTVDELGGISKSEMPNGKTLASLFKMLMQLFLHCDTWRVPTGYNGLKTGGAYT
jgi:hypothetical protein